MGWGRTDWRWAGILVAWACLGSLAACERSELKGVGSDLSAAPGRLDFGAVPLGAVIEKELTVVNSSRTALEVTDVTSGVAAVAVQGERAFTLGPGEERRLTVRFSPSVEGQVAGLLQLITDANVDEGVRQVDLSGTGVRSKVEAGFDGLDFGNVEVDTTEVLELPISNTSSASAELTLTFTGDDADLFGSSQTTETFQLPAGRSMRLPISFRPTRLGAAQARAQLSPCRLCDPVTVDLSGNGVAAMLEIAPSRLDFGQVEIHARSEQRVTIRNNGTSPMTYRGSKVLSDPRGLFRLESEPPVGTSLEPGSGFELVVSFGPSEAGLVKGPLLEVGLRADDSEGPGPKLPMQGEGGVGCIVLEPRTLAFGPVPEGMSTTRTVQALNRCAEAISVVGASVSASEGGFFSLPRPQVGTSIAPGQRVPIDVSFQPQPGSTRSAGMLQVRAQQGTKRSSAGVALEGSLGAFEDCNYRLTPAPVDFGRVAVGSSTRLGWILQNVGSTDCFVGGMALAAGSAPAFSANRVDGQVVGPGGRLILWVDFLPASEGTFSALAEAWVNHPTRGHPTTAITGQGARACVALEPSAIDFGTVKRGCGVKTRSVRVHNRCELPVSLTGASLQAQHTVEGELTLSGTPGFPASLAVGSSRDVTVAYLPLDDGEDPGSLSITTDLAGALTVGVKGLGLEKPLQTDRFIQEAQGQVDVLFVIDNSGSMMEEQRSLAQNFSSFLSAAQRTGVDYQIAVTTTGIEPSSGGYVECPGGASGGEGGRLFPVDNATPRIIRVDTPDAAAVFANNVRVGWCHWNEQGLEAAYRALAAPLINHADDPRTSLPNDGNLGFLRPEARLVLVFLSDEEDFSPQGVPFYETFFRGVKGHDESLLSVLAIVGPRNLSTCPTASSSGTRYLALAEATGGATESICTTNWAASLEALSVNAFGPRRRFPLTARPSPASGLVVKVNGVEVSGGYSYDADGNAVLFGAGSVPDPGSVIEVTYPLGC